MRRLVLALLALVVALAVGGAAWRYVAAGDPTGRLVITEVRGPVTLTSAGRPAPAGEGDVLDGADQLATGPDGRAVLELGGAVIRLGPVSSMVVQGVDTDGVRLELQDGQLQATVRPGTAAVRVDSKGREIVATNADFSVGVHEDVLQVATGRGEVRLTGVDPPTVLAEGQLATVVDGSLTREALPTELLLAVEWADERRTRAVTQVLTGSTSPGAEVTIRGSFGKRTVRADKRGRFSAEVPLAEGENPVELTATDVLGRNAEVTGTLAVRDTTGPTLRSQ